MIPQHELNRRRWDAITPVHARSEFYDLSGFLAGRNTLSKLEIEGVGEVCGKSLLHLQCHFGMDTLSWARLGAQVVGVDFSEASILQANDLAVQTGLSNRARFVCCDVLELDEHLNEKFDIVFTSYGVLTWLSNLERWAEIVANFLKPGGRFFIAEIHPFSFLFDEQSESFRLAYDYSTAGVALEIPPGPDFADPSHTHEHGERYWAWSLSEIFSALRKAELTISDFQEYPFSCFRQFPQLEKREDSFWHLPPGTPQIPLLFTLTAAKV